MADIPGLIAGAGEGAGLGHQFLRHVERCRLLLHVLDLSGSEGRDPLADFECINRELASFNAELAARPMIVVGNKCDLIEEEAVAEYKRYFSDKGYAFFPIMAAIAEGTGELINYVAAELQKLPPVRRYEPEAAPKIDYLKPDKRAFTLKVEQGVFIIEAPWLLKVLEGVDPDDYESLQYFQRVLHASGIIDALKAAGVRDGDTVSVYDIEFEYLS